MDSYEEVIRSRKKPTRNAKIEKDTTDKTLMVNYYMVKRPDIQIITAVNLQIIRQPGLFLG